MTTSTPASTPATADQSAWQNIPHDTADTGDEARERIAIVLDKDPFVRMLAPEIRGCMVEGFAMALIHDRPVKNSVMSYDHRSTKQRAGEALKVMPLGFLTDGFKDHVLGLVAFALIPHPKYDDWHRPL